MASSLARASDVGSNLTVMAAGLSVAVKALGAAMAVPIKAAIEQERVEAQLSAVLLSTKSAAGLSSDALLDMASAYQSATTFGDQAVISAQNILLTFTEIGGEGGIFDRTTGVILDMSAALGTSLKEQSIQVGKALNDPIKGVSALAEVGVTFTLGQKEMIKALAESGDMAAAQTVILDELAKEFGGSAAAAKDTFGGALASLSNQWDSLQEAAGRFITQNEGIRDIISDVSEVVGEWAEELDGLQESSAGQADVADILRGAIIGVLEAVQGMNSAFAFLGEVVLETIQKLAAMTGKILPLTSAQRDLAEQIEETKQQIEDLNEAVEIETIAGAGDAAEAAAEEFAFLNGQLNDQEAAFKKAMAAGIDMSSSADALNARLEQLSDKLRETGDEAQDTAEDLKETSDAAKELGAAIAEVAPPTSLKDLQGARMEIQKLLGEMRSAPGAFDAWSKQWENLRASMVGTSLDDQLLVMQQFSKELGFQAGFAKDFTAEAVDMGSSLDFMKGVLEDLGPTLGELGEKFTGLFDGEQKENIDEMTIAILEAEQVWMRSIENMGRATSSEFSGIFEDWTAKNQDMSDGFAEFGDHVKETLADAFFEPILGAESAFNELFTAALAPVKQLGKAIGSEIFGPLIASTLKFFGVKTAQETAAAAASSGIQGASALATVATQQAAVAAMMPGLAAAAAASLIATFGTASASAALLPGILGTAAASGKATAAALAIPLAEGAFVDRSTFANIGEAGPEVVLPLNRPGRMRQILDEAGARLGVGGRGGGSVISFTINVNGGSGDPETLGATIADIIDEKLGSILASN